ncbi:MAG: ribosome biogenesis GTP-binding protein YihA/YsxC [Pseudomonadota bacterium]|nr:ribosome biogenesis GTP-binding protein YihA/YsxC [Pseudomonadota bacterium]MEC7956093.1 ribosome biogenesis GTP-binding protein YihA/YsxC [Pseudomonadota bacterium]MEC8695964.1 ribosome biogenesis GTP-binding protein YihA/YsxC [Pseudomonadota bacterium]MEE3174359.1 ribosome biogenesis GTP-binding protein YihA/YsxC [Pseudomonadota bacterium]
MLAPKPKPSSAGFTLHQTPQRRDGAIIYQDKQVLLPERLEATFLTSAPDLRRCPPADAPEVAFAGRSNAGKSSVLNQLSGNRRTAKVSKTPGRTQLLNFFDVRQGGRLVDLPGYGYAKATVNAQQQWQKAVNHYLSYRDSLVGLVLVMDIRHPNQPFDEDMLNWAKESELPIHILLNKADKLGRNAQQQALSHMRRLYTDHPTASMQCFSATKGTGKAQLLALLLEWLAAPLENTE